MNKYKIISICSLTIVCVLIMSLLLPIKTIANDKESLEMEMHYAESKVTLDIVVNSDVYTGVVCKYLMLDDVLVEEDLVTKTKEKGTTINLDKTENDKYNTTIKDVNKRYVVIYVSIGNCSLCDYIDCQPSTGENKQENQTEQPVENKQENKTEQPTENKQENKTEQPAENKQENKTEQPTENKQENKTEQPAENKQENKTEQPAENKQENKTEQPAENKQENKTEQPAENKQENKTEQPAENKQENKTEQPTENKQENKTEQPTNNNQTTNNTQQTNKSTNQSNSNGINLNNYNKNTNTSTNGNSNMPVNGDKDSINVNNPVSGDKDSINVNKSASGDIDSIDTSDFQEIEKTITTSTADGDMPKTGEDDFIKILGIVVFSALSIISFYKYQKTK